MYGKITAIMDEKIPRDYEYHTMVQVIWVSTTLEFWLKAIYEYTIWRITSLWSCNTPIDRYYTEISRKYVDFILLRPWYEFNYTDAIMGLQYDTWSSLVRSTERYLLYYGEFFIKKLYAKIIENAAKSSFATPDIWTGVRGNFPVDVASVDPKNINITHDGIKITRYYPFTEILPKILELPLINIADIAGNKKIVIETISSSGEISTWSIFSFNVPIDASKKRNYIYLKPESIKNYMNSSSAKITHIYDF